MDWIRLFEDHNIEFVTQGKNTRRGWASVKCPWCGEDDPSQHLGIHLTAERWGCLREPSHRGRQPAPLVAALLGCSVALAKMTVNQYSQTDPDTLDEVITAMAQDPYAEDRAELEQLEKDLRLLGEFKHIKQEGPTARFWRYLRRRGFEDVEGLCSRYSLMCAMTGRFKDRVILPVYNQKKLIGWTARAISDPQNAPRYLTQGDIKSVIFNEDELEWGGDTMFVTEGPFDALKLDFYGAPATCLFGVTPTTEQLAALARLSSHWERIVILFDEDATGPSFYVDDWVNARNVIIGQLPEGVKDPGLLTPKQIHHLAESYAKVDLST